MERQWANYLRFANQLHYKKGEKIYSANGKEARGIYYLKAGMIKITVTNNHNHRRIIDLVSETAFMGLFGEQLIYGGRYFSSVIALEDSIVYLFSPATTQKLLKNDLPFNLLLQENLINKVMALSKNIVRDTFPSEKRLADSLLYLAQQCNRLTLPLNQRELSLFTGLSRITIYTLFKQWGTAVVELKKGTVIIKDLDYIAQIDAKYNQ